MSNLERRAIGLEATYPERMYDRLWSHYWLSIVTAVLSVAIAAAAVMKVWG